jgi:RNA polymerase sigma factor (sigma-70 family)
MSSRGRAALEVTDPASVIQHAHPRLMGAARGLTRSPADAEDLVQEAFVETLSRYPDFRGLEAPLGYLMTVLYRAAFKKQRRARMEIPLELQTKMAAVEPDPDASILAQEALAGLGPKQRACLVLRYLYDMDEREIAKALDCRPSTVRSQLARARANARGEVTDG